ncbi:MAG TPA: hypothetical protein HPQ00_05925, partial [Magnetococcales bacterium]|nr:hypothetical protein [Magnetococcales bacterium]
MSEQEKSTQWTIELLAHHNRLLLQAIGDGVCGVDVNEETTFINEAGAAMLG